MDLCRRAMDRFNRSREALIQRLGADLESGESPALVRRAVNEAEALAWSTSYPMLFLPALAEEKVADARRWTRRQHEVLAKQRALEAAF